MELRAFRVCVRNLCTRYRESKTADRRNNLRESRERSKRKDVRARVSELALHDGRGAEFREYRVRVRVFNLSPRYVLIYSLSLFILCTLLCTSFWKRTWKRSNSVSHDISSKILLYCSITTSYMLIISSPFPEIRIWKKVRNDQK